MKKKERLPAFIDFDDVLLNPKDIPQGKRMGNPLPYAKESLIEIKKMGYRIVIFTVRGAEANKKHVEDWLRFYEIPFDEVTNIKTKAAFYLDNRNLVFKNWDETMQEIRKL
jgi:hypothetical protein